MPRSRNDITERSIRAAAWALFLEKGTSATSYTDLAQASGVSRPLVQRYVPKKALLVKECVAAIRDAADRACGEAFPTADDPLVRLYLLGQVNVAAYFSGDGIRRIMLDVFASRELTRQTIDDNFVWTVSEMLPGHPLSEQEGEPDELVMAMGGLYELLYVHLARGTEPRFSTCTLPSVKVFGEVYGLPFPEGGFAPHAIPEADLRELARHAAELISW